MSHLQKLVTFKTISALSNLDFIQYVEEQLRVYGLEPIISYDETGMRANLHALIGPKVDGGVVLNGHTDVVPVEGQDWKSDPFSLTQRDNKLYARGAVDMKGFLACMLAAVPLWQQKTLRKPIQISMCFDEEIGGFGAPILVDSMLHTAPKPAIAIIGEPTRMQIVSAHKGGFEMRTQFTGHEAHSSDPRNGVNAIVYATRFITYLNEINEELAFKPDRSSGFDPDYATINVGTIEGGAARNIVAGSCAFDWELRPLPSTDGEAVLAKIENFANTVLLPEMQKRYPKAKIQTDMRAIVPALSHDQAEQAIKFVSNITGLNATHAVPFATDAGHFAAADISTIVLGPGSIEQAHKPDEYIELEQIAACMEFLDKLGNALAQ